MNKKYLPLLDEGWEHTESAFEGLGFADAPQLQAKAYLRAAILSQIQTLKMTQIEAARRVGLTQPKMSLLMTGSDSSGFSSDKLIDIAISLGLEVTITATPPNKSSGKLTIGRSRRRL